jgi:uncharacterized protein (TIGR01777 family)
MPVFEWRSTMPVSADELYAWHARAGAFARLTPPWQNIRVIEQSGGIADGARLVFEYRVGPWHGRWTAVHELNQPGRGFVDRQVEGPFAAWRHEHRFIARSEHESVMEDHVEFALPWGSAGALGNRRAQRELERVFRFRHERLHHDLERHLAFAGRPRLRVAVTGASGLIGSQLVAFLATGGHEVRRLVRRAPAAADEVRWDPARGELDPAALVDVDAVVNLAGENIGQRWTPTKRTTIKTSREHSTTLLADTIARLSAPLPVLVNASAVGYYGASSSAAVLTEDSPAGNDYLAEVCVAWEGATTAARDGGARVVTPRFGVVMSAREGALARQVLPYKLAAGGPVGSGKQWLSWVAPDDLLAIILTVLYDSELSGAINAVAPAPVSNREFARTLGHIVRRPAMLPLPAAAVRIGFGEMGDVMLLRGQRVVPARLQTRGFQWFYPGLESALRFELGLATGASA